MKHIAWGIVIGGAAAAAFAGSGVAGATGGTWTPDYDVDNAQLFAGLPTLGQEAWSPAWELPVSFTSSDGTTLTGTDYITASSGGFNDEFITKDGATYDQNQLFPGFTNLYYDPAGDGAAVDVMKTPFGSFDMSSMATTFAPPELPTVNAETVGGNIVFADSGGLRITEALELLNGSDHWAGGPTVTSVTPMETPDSSLVWAVPATFTQGSGPDAPTLTGTEYVTSPTDVEFVTDNGAVFDQHTLASGLFFVDNVYYDPAGGGPAQDFLQMPFVSLDISPLASWFAPDDVADLVTPSPATDLADAGLYSALDLMS